MALVKPYDRQQTLAVLTFHDSRDRFDNIFQKVTLSLLSET